MPLQRRRDHSGNDGQGPRPVHSLLAENEIVHGAEERYYFVKGGRRKDMGRGSRNARVGGERGMRQLVGVIVLVVGILGALGSLSAQDSLSSLRCGTRLVVVGETKTDVAVKCGPPLYQQYVGEKIVRTPYGYDKIVVEEWVYNFGPTDFLHTLRFEGGRLAVIFRGERGY